MGVPPDMDNEANMDVDRIILVAEDDELIRAIMCASTAEALALVNRHSEFCAAFIDIDLGDRGGGYEVARKVHETLPGVKIVYTSGGPQGDFEHERVQDALFVPKPYTPDRVCALFAESGC
jgi:DNA-binding LytR/AlgR family response regulator